MQAKVDRSVSDNFSREAQALMNLKASLDEAPGMIQDATALSADYAYDEWQLKSEEQKKEYKTAVKKGDIPASWNPFFNAAQERLAAASSVEDYQMRYTKAVHEKKLKGGEYDPVAFRAEFYEGYLQGEGLDGYRPEALGVFAKGVERVHTAEIAENARATEAVRLEKFGTNLMSAMNNVGSAGLSEPDMTAGFKGLIKSYVSDLGFPMDKGMQMVKDTLQAKYVQAITNGDADPARFLRVMGSMDSGLTGKGNKSVPFSKDTVAYQQWTKDTYALADQAAARQFAQVQQLNKALNYKTQQDHGKDLAAWTKNNPGADPEGFYKSKTGKAWLEKAEIMKLSLDKDVQRMGDRMLADAAGEILTPVEVMTHIKKAVSMRDEEKADAYIQNLNPTSAQWNQWEASKKIARDSQHIQGLVVFDAINAEIDKESPTSSKAFNEQPISAVGQIQSMPERMRILGPIRKQAEAEVYGILIDPELTPKEKQSQIAVVNKDYRADIATAVDSFREVHDAAKKEVQKDQLHETTMKGALDIDMEGYSLLAKGSNKTKHLLGAGRNKAGKVRSMTPAQLVASTIEERTKMFQNSPINKYIAKKFDIDITDPEQHRKLLEIVNEFKEKANKQFGVAPEKHVELNASIMDFLINTASASSDTPQGNGVLTPLTDAEKAGLVDDKTSPDAKTRGGL
jgi:hypothetical protein